MKTCFLFPGQGAQYRGMARDLWEKSARVRSLFVEASDCTGRDVPGLLFESTEEELKDTANTQIAMTVANVAAAEYLSELGVEAHMCAGFSLGEFSALHEAGVLTRASLFSAVVKRGEIMAEASSVLAAGGEAPGMAAVLGLSLEDALPVLRELDARDVFLANHSSPTQIVIAGAASGLRTAEELFDKAGAIRFVSLKVSGPFHSPLMERARQALAGYLQSVDFHDPVKPIFANVTGAAIQTGEEARRLCASQVVSTVQWVRTEENLLKLGVGRCLEVGPGKVLSGLWKSFTKEIRCFPAGAVESIAEVA